MIDYSIDQQNNYKELKEAIEGIELSYILSGKDFFKLENSNGNSFYVKPKKFSSSGNYYCELSVEKYGKFRFLSLHENVTKKMHKEYKLYQNWKYFKKLDDLVEMFKTCVLAEEEVK